MYSFLITALISIFLWSTGFPEHALIYSCLVGIVNTLKSCNDIAKERKEMNRIKKEGKVIFFEKERQLRKNMEKNNIVSIKKSS